MMDLLRKIFAMLFGMSKKIDSIEQQLSQDDPATVPPQPPQEEEEQDYGEALGAPWPDSVEQEEEPEDTEPEEEEPAPEPLPEPDEQPVPDAPIQHGVPEFDAVRVHSTGAIELRVDHLPGTLKAIARDKVLKTPARKLKNYHGTFIPVPKSGVPKPKKIEPGKYHALIYLPHGAKRWAGPVWFWGLGDVIRFEGKSVPASAYIRFTGTGVVMHGTGKLVATVNNAATPDDKVFFKPTYPGATFRSDVRAGQHITISIDLDKVPGTAKKYLHVALVRAGAVVVKATKRVG